MTREPSKQDFCPSSQPHYTSAKYLVLHRSIRGRNSGMRIAQIISSSSRQQLCFSSGYTPAAGQTISRTRLKAMLRFHTMFHATQAYLDEWETPVASLCLQPSEATSMITCRDDNVDTFNIIGLLGRTETLPQKMTYPDFLWDHKCYHAYFMATLTNLRAQWRQRHSGPIPRRCHNYDSTKIGDVVVGMPNPKLDLEPAQAGHITGVVPAKRLFGLHKFIRCH